METKCEILIDDPFCRFKKGDIGLIMPNDSEKYDYKVSFGILTNQVIFSEAIDLIHIVYFYKHEIKLIKEL